ncbi:UxaA family hydrolase [Cuneatibacter caecimuris]|uniref:SAF domain-containing protein n=1 Tax=Cuneatibacter caecimuris TaxID=1796618 RepID=A0A4Q7NZD5_9FIRM|nr:UxaA family hydrolase [Cuneatibacter caecimuris]RZS92420.1 SAF domain-containing protein [Cuneatibacter caecimuris]
MEQTAFQIHSKDNVATALSPLSPGNVRLTGEGPMDSVLCTEPIPKGHKIALKKIRQGELILKYGVPIGCAIRDIPPGTFVHLHCIRSLYDERSSHLDPATGAPLDTRYE